MDKRESGKECFEDVTRKALIEISYQVPDEDPTAEKSLKEIDGKEVVEPLVSDRYEEYRSKLISISHSSSPKVKVLPVSPGQPNV